MSATRSCLLIVSVLLCAGCSVGPLASTPAAAPVAQDPYVQTGQPLRRGPGATNGLVDGVTSDKAWSPSVSFRTGFILGGSDAPNAFFNGATVSLNHRFHIASKLSVSLSYERRDYDLESGRGLYRGLGRAPTEMQTLGISASLFQPLSPEWAVFLTGGIAGSTEVGVDPFTDPGLFGLGVLGHQLNPSLQLGLGVVVAARAGEDPFFFPVPHIKWQINERWMFRTEETGGSLNYELSDTLLVSGLARLDTRRYLLDDAGPGTPGIFEDSRTSLALRLQWRPSAAVRFNFIGGLDVLRYLEVADDDGNVLSDERAGLGGYIQINGSIAF